MSQSRTGLISGILLAGLTVWCAGFLAAPFLLQGEGWVRHFGRAAFTFYGEICHQLPDRSLPAGDDIRFAVCVRCMAIYCAFLAGTATAVVFGIAAVRNRQAMMLAAVLPMVVEVVSGLLGLHEQTMLSRFVTGAWFGLLSPAVLLPLLTGGIGDTIDRLVRRPVG